MRAVGTTRDPHFEGSVAVTNAAFTVATTGSKYKAVTCEGCQKPSVWGTFTSFFSKPGTKKGNCFAPGTQVLVVSGATTAGAGVASETL